MSSINRVLRNIAATKEQTSHTHHLSSATAAATADSVYDKLRMFNGQAAAASWAWYGAAASVNYLNNLVASVKFTGGIGTVTITNIAARARPALIQSLRRHD